MSKQRSFYDPSTGLFTGRVIRCPDAALEANTPAGMAAIEGRFDERTQRVDVQTGEVVAYDAPPDPVEKRNRARARIRALEAKQKRPLRELSIDPSNDEAKRRLQEIDAEISELRRAL
jgi:hypothetical protein